MSEWPWLPAVGEPFQGRTRCCDEDTGGSHSHCGRCGTVGSYQGCYGNYDALRSTLDGKKKEGRGWGFYCPEPWGFATMEQFQAERAEKAETE